MFVNERETGPGFGRPDLVDRLDRICRSYHMDSLLPQLSALRETLHGSGTINVALVGSFKAGKSSFINSLVGRPLMPVAVLPATAVITRVGYGDQDKAEVRYLDGRVEGVPLGDIAGYITEQNNPGNAKRVARVDIELGDLGDYAGVHLVDTPGLGSVYAHNTLASMEWLPRVGAALVAVSIDHPLSEDDASLLKTLDAYTPEIALLITKADLVSRKELEEVLAFVRSQSESLLGRRVRIFPFSIRPGYESARREVQDYLAQSVVARHLQKSGEIAAHKLRAIADGCREYLGVALSAATSATETREILMRQLDQERQALSVIQNETWLVAADAKSRLRAEAAEAFLEHYRAVLSALSRDLRVQMRRWRGNLDATSTAFRRWTKDQLVGRLKAISDAEGPRLAERNVAVALASLSRAVRAFQDRLAESIEQTLHMTFEGAKFEAGVEREPPTRNEG